MEYFVKEANKINEFCELVTAVKGGTPCCVTGLSGIHKSLFISALSEGEKRILVLTSDEASADRMVEDINTLSLIPSKASPSLSSLSE